ncbi:MAG TPA: aromatic amino acid ammonia-lyase [Ktedonobacterales bacterium]|nr:aromatic amino acid ammonia-lyase [Ktedonobacterales bacterium]
MGEMAGKAKRAERATTRTIAIDGESLRLEDVQAVAREGVRVALTANAETRDRLEAGWRLNHELIGEGRPIYGVTTGVGDSVGRQIAPERAALMQKYLMRLNGCGTGPTLPVEYARAVVLVRANCLAKGYSAVRPLLIERLLDLLNEDYVPVIPEQGSVGASGDLIPGSYVAAALMGERKVTHGGEVMPSARAWEALGKEPLELQAKEGLALVNGTHLMAGIAALAVLDAERVARVADVCTAMLCEALSGIVGAFHPFILRVKPHVGSQRSAAAIRALLEESQLVRTYDQTVEQAGRIGKRGYRELSVKIQDNYSLRCAPQCIGALYDTVAWSRGWIETEINSANDNPLYDVEQGRVYSGGNFAGFHVALAMDTLKTAVASISDLLDRQFELMVDEKYNNGLTPNLIARLPDDHPEKGIFHGFKVMQLAISALAAEALNKCTPMTVFSRSTECHNQDKVSMGAIAARQARDVIELAERCCAIHLLAACQAADLRGPERLGRTRLVYDRIRAVSPFVERDRELEEDIYAVAEMVHSGALLEGLVSDADNV